MANWITVNGRHIDLDDPNNPVTGSGSFATYKNTGSSKDGSNSSSSSTQKKAISFFTKDPVERAELDRRLVEKAEKGYREGIPSKTGCTPWAKQKAAAMGLDIYKAYGVLNDNDRKVLAKYSAEFNKTEKIHSDAQLNFTKGMIKMGMVDEALKQSKKGNKALAVELIRHAERKSPAKVPKELEYNSKLPF